MSAIEDRPRCAVGVPDEVPKKMSCISTIWQDL
jgi:hypothetical protein